MNVKNIGLLSENEKIEIIYLQGEKINLLEKKIKQLKSRLTKHTKKHSKNSHKPPSSDQNKKKTNSLRKKSDKKVGGQPGHEAHNLKFSNNPDENHYHTINQCECCGERLKKKVDKILKRQIFEIPKPKFIVIEHQGEIKRCNNCGHINKAVFPEGVTKLTQYGARAKSIMVYLRQYQLLPYNRLKLLFQTLYNHTLSAGTIYN